MATYKEIIGHIEKCRSIKVQTCWIAHVKELSGLSLIRVPNRKFANVRKKPCPSDKIEIIRAALRHFDMI
jgi:hypothetical protein